jgi:hypothetical protein
MSDLIRARLYSIPRGGLSFDVRFSLSGQRAGGALGIQPLDGSQIPFGEYELVWESGTRSARVTNKGIGWQILDLPK